MLHTISSKLERVQALMNHVDELNDRMRLLMAMVEKEDREEKDRLRYCGILEGVRYRAEE